MSKFRLRPWLPAGRPKRSESDPLPWTALAFCFLVPVFGWFLFFERREDLRQIRGVFTGTDIRYYVQSLVLFLTFWLMSWFFRQAIFSVPYVLGTVVSTIVIGGLLLRAEPSRRLPFFLSITISLLFAWFPPHHYWAAFHFPFAGLTLLKFRLAKNIQRSEAATA